MAVLEVDRRPRAVVRQAVRQAVEPAAAPRNLGLKRFARNHLAVAGAIIIVLGIGAAAAAPLLAPYPPGKIDLLHINRWPSRAHLLGTSASGVDMLSEAVFALRTSFGVAAIAQSITLTLGLLIGVSAGYFGGKVDLVLSRLIDILFAFPAILVGLLLAATFGQPMYQLFGPIGRLYVTIAALSLVFWVGTARVMRGQALSLREAQFIQAARATGAGNVWILRKHVLPNVLGTAAVLVSLGFGDAIGLEAVLSFLGLGVTPPTASLGQMIQGGELYVDPYWYQLVLPGGILAVLVLSFAFLGDGFRDAFDTRMRDV